MASMAMAGAAALLAHGIQVAHLSSLGGPGSHQPGGVARTNSYGVLLPTWYLTYDDAIREPLMWAASQVPIWAVVCSDHDLTGAVTPLCDRSTGLANKTDDAIAQLRQAGVHVLHYIHSRKLYWPNGTAEGCKPHCECCDSVANVTRRVDEVLRRWPDDGIFIDNVNGSRALEGYYSAVYARSQREGPREVILNMGDRYRNWSWLFDYSSMIVGAECYVATFNQTTSLSKRDFDYFRFSNRLAAIVYDDKPAACNASQCWKQYVDLAIERGFTKIWFQGSGWQITYWRSMIAYLRSKNHRGRTKKTESSRTLKTDDWLALDSDRVNGREDSGGSPACVVDGVVRATCFGRFNATDSTDMLQAALSSSAFTVIIDRSPSGEPWLVRPLYVTSSNKLLVFEERVHIMAKRDEFHGLFDTLLTVSSVHNVTIEGNGAILQMRRDDYAVPSRGTCPSCAPYAKAEWRMGIGLHNASSISIRNLTVLESGGDGIYISGPNGLPGSRDIHIADCVFDKNYRQGMSVIGVVNMLVERTVLSRTNGTAPSAGVDIEPYLPTFEITNVSFIDCRASNNSGPGFAFYISHFNETTAPFEVLLSNFTITSGDSFGISVDYIAPGVRGSMMVVNSSVRNTRFSPLAIIDKAALDSFVTIRGCSFGADSPVTNSVDNRTAPISFIADAGCHRGWRATGGVQFEHVTVHDTHNRPWLYSSVEPGLELIGVTGVGLTVVNPNGCTQLGPLKLTAECKKAHSIP